MASIRVRIDDFEDGVLPGICASSGVPTSSRYVAQISSKSPPWLLLLILGGPLGIVLALVLAGVLRKTATGYLPYADEVQDVLRRRQRRYAQGVVACAALFAGALVLVATDSSFGSLGLLLLGVAVVVGLGFGFLWSNVPGSVGGYLDSTARWIELSPVSAAFADAYERQERARRAERRSDAADRPSY